MIMLSTMSLALVQYYACAYFGTPWDMLTKLQQIAINHLTAKGRESMIHGQKDLIKFIIHEL